MKKEEKKEEKKEKLEEKVTISSKEYQDLKEKASLSEQRWDGLLRLHAEFDNFRKRMGRDKEEFIKYANADIISDLLGVVDDLERAVETASQEQDFPVLSKGVEMTLNRMRKVLEDRGVEEIECVGKPFDPTEHEAVMSVNDDEAPEDIVVEELQKGYRYHDRVIRPAKVKLSKKEEKENKQQTPDKKN